MPGAIAPGVEVAVRVGFVGWRGMVGSVLMERMREEGDFTGLQPTFFSTSSPGAVGPDVGAGPTELLDAGDLDALSRQDVVVTCQGSDHTLAVLPALRARGWRGSWVDASSALRMEPDAVLVLDPVNGEALEEAIRSGARTFVGANCTVSLMLMGLVGLIRTGRVEWISSMTYQAASGAGAGPMTELVRQMRALGDATGPLLNASAAALDIDRAVATTLRAPAFPTDGIGAPLAASALPWIDRAVEDGQTREEWKAMVEANKLLSREHDPLPIDGLCVRIGAMRCHAQALTIKLRSPMDPEEAASVIAGAHPWVEVVPNEREATLARLTPAAVAGSLQVPVGRIRRMKLGPEYLTAFTVGDQLLWGAAEPLRRVLGLLRTRG
ncbi:MAG: aspartate-semialdehyde dehydrogenase [Myxococcales bacterium]|nr:aspartate-semialdehyde dehydrogenase [Myxococcales bacterium]